MDRTMNQSNKIKLFVDKEDIEIICTKHNIINITGMIGSGKSTTADKYRNDKNYIVISLDCLYRGQDKKNMNNETVKINQILTKKFSNKQEEKYFREYYNEILNYINQCNTSVTFVLEGQHIYRYLKLEDIKGKLIIKRTAIMKCWKRSIVRQIKEKRIELKHNKITKEQYYQDMWYWIKRRTKQLKHYKDLNDFLDKVKNVNRQNRLSMD